MTVETRSAERFWIWTELNRARIRETLKAARRSIPGVHIVLVDPLICEMTSELHAFDDRLSPLIALAKDDVLELTITAGARVEAFGSVDLLMSLAPVGPAWRFYALRRRRPVEHALLDGRELRGVENIRFDLCAENDGVRATLIVGDHLADAIADLQDAGAHVVQSLIGERDFGLHRVKATVLTRSASEVAGVAANALPLEDFVPTFDALAPRDLRRVA